MEPESRGTGTRFHFKNPECPGMKVNEKNGVVWLTFPQIEAQKGFRHGFSTRLGGVSQGYLGSMNLSTARGDTPENVQENLRRLGECIGFEPKNLVLSHQTHTANVRTVTEADRGCGIVKERPYQDVDGLITNVPGLMLMTFYADCVPLFFVDPVHRAVGLTHSGWRGTVQQIGRVTLERMREEYGTRPEDVIAAIGPSICQDCYEVSEDVIDEFRKVYAPEKQKEIFYRKENGKYQLDLWKANRILLMNSGIRPENMNISELCTCCNSELLFSHRASQGKRGNRAAFLGIQKN